MRITIFIELNKIKKLFVLTYIKQSLTFDLTMSRLKIKLINNESFFSFLFTRAHDLKNNYIKTLLFCLRNSIDRIFSRFSFVILIKKKKNLLSSE